MKPSEIISYQSNTFDTVDIKSFIAEHPKNLHTPSKTIIRQAEKVGSNSSLFSDTKNMDIFKNNKTKCF